MTELVPKHKAALTWEAMLHIACCTCKVRQLPLTLSAAECQTATFHRLTLIGQDVIDTVQLGLGGVKAQLSADCKTD